MLTRIFLLAKNASSERRMARLLGRLHVHVSGASRGKNFWEELGESAVDVVVADLTALPKPSLAAVQTMRQLPETPDVIIVSGDEDPAQRASLLSAGALAVLFAGLSDQALRGTLAAIIQRRREEALKRRQLHVSERSTELADFISRSPAMTKLIEIARRVANVDTSLLILGETGVGKERLGKAIHSQSPRTRGPFVAVNCAAIPESLLESELFGHEKGAFTGAHRARRGHFELADRGTLFLDEVGEMSAATQVKLLRALQEHRIRPVGSEHSVDVDVRIMAATNRDLTTEIATKRFRADLYYRLGVVTLEVPPLRERREDIPDLVDYYREHFVQRLRRPVAGVAEEAMHMLVSYDWPGNVRELINVMEHATLLCQDNVIGPSDLPDIGNVAAASGAVFGDRLELSMAGWSQKPWSEVRAGLLRAGEKRYLEALLRETAGRINVTAARAGLSVRSLSRKMRRTGLRKEAFRRPQVARQ